MNRENLDMLTCVGLGMHSSVNFKLIRTCIHVYIYIMVIFFAVAVLADNNRLQKVSPVIKAYGTIMTAYRGEVSCVVTSAEVS